MSNATDINIKGYSSLTGRGVIYNSVLALLAVLAAAGIAFGLHALYAGHDQVYGVTRDVPWGLLIATYVFFVVTSTGLCLVSSLGHVFGFESFHEIGKRAVYLAICTIISGFLVISFEIENPWRMAIYNVLSPNLTSNIWWMGTLYGAYLFFMVSEFALLVRGNHRAAGLLGLLGVAAGIAAHSNLGAVFGLLNGRQFWHGPYMPIYFIASAMMSGCAAILFFTYLAHRINDMPIDSKVRNSLRATGRLGMLLMATLMFFITWKVLSGLAGYPPGKFEAMMTLIAGSYAPNFWIGEILLGMALPFSILLITKAESPKWAWVAGLVSLIGIFFMRYDLVVVGQIVPAFHSLGAEGYKGILTYTPSLHEVMITVGGLSLCGLMFLIGEQVFRGHQ
ncbi:MAG: polysulfide reductase NrfD [Thermodesulfobacteria bacterium]|nr:polysulfide reductase NrfD [Thermodesulfobacteriota bacterium]